MTDQQHPITPPPELVAQWIDAATGSNYEAYIAAVAAQWGADQELEACCECLDSWGDIHNSYGYELASDLRAARRLKPLSLKEQALAELVDAYDEDKIDDTAFDTIHRALKQLE